MEASEKCVVGEKCLVVSQLISRALGQDDVISQFVSMISTQLGVVWLSHYVTIASV